MSAAPETPRPARYGSAAELAAYTGLSLKTVRRRVRDGTLKGVRIGRRVLIPFEDVDRRAAEEPQGMAIAPTPTQPDTIDSATGRLLPLTDEQRRARSEALRRALDDVEAMAGPDDTDDAWREVMRGVDEGRPHRPLFGGQY